MVLQRFWLYARPYRATIVLATIYSVLNKLFDILPEVLIGVAVDVVVNRDRSFLAKIGITDSMSQLAWLGVITFVIWFLESLFEYLYQIQWRMLAQQIQHQMRMDAFGHIQNLGMSYFEDRSSGNLLSILNDDINQLERFLDKGATTIIHLVTGSIAIGLIFFYLAPQVALIALMPIPVILFGAFYFRGKLEPKYKTVRERAGHIGARLANSLAGIATIKSFTNEKFELALLKQDSEAYLNANREAIQISSTFVPIIRMAIMAGFIVTTVWGGYLAMNGSLAVGGYSILVFLTQRLLWPFTDLAQTVDFYQRAVASANRVFTILDTPIDVSHGFKALDRQHTKGEIRFDDVSFQYANGLKVFESFSLLVPAGKTVAFVGATGAGKSTLVKLLLRFYEPTSGHILLDGTSIADIRMEDYRRLIGFVSQDVFLFHGTIRENIGYGRLGATSEEIEAAAIAAEAHEFILQMPQGYDTLVGERGQKLSGGQRQRISIARAVLKNPPIYLLDEATSAVDNETEEAIQQSINFIAKNHTTIVIAHRLSTIRHAHQIVVLDQGKIMETGTHDELVKQEGIYKRLWSIQTGA